MKSEHSEIRESAISAEQEETGRERAAEALAAMTAPRGGAAEPPPPAPPGWPAGVPWLRPGRAHEVQGRASRAFAALIAALIPAEGAVVWIRPAQARGRLDGFGAAALFDPDRLVIAQVASAEDGFWAMEESLRSGAAALVALEARRRPDLTVGRRLQLAAEAAAPAPIGLILIDPDDLGADRRRGRGAAAAAPKTASAAETRWRIAPLGSAAAGGGGPAWLWTLEKNKRGPVGAWRVGQRGGQKAEQGRPAQPEGEGAHAAATDRLALDAAVWRGAAAAA